MQRANSIEKPVLFNKKLFPLLKRYIMFSNSPLQLSSFWLLFIITPFMLIPYSYIFIPFFFLLLLSNLVLTGKYGVSENIIISMFPISKKQSVLVKCFHLLLVQILLFGVIIALSYIKAFTVDNKSLYTANKYLAIAVLIISCIYMNVIILGVSFKDTPLIKKPVSLLIGFLSLFIIPVFFPMLLQSNSFLLENLTNNLKLSRIILYVSFAVFILSTILMTAIAIKTCSLYEVEETNNKDNDTSPLSQAKPDSLFLNIYIKLLKLFKVNESTIKLIRKDCNFLPPSIFIIIASAFFLLSYVPVINMMPFVIYGSMIAAVPNILFVLTGDLKTSYLFPIKRNDYIKSKIIHAFFLQSTVLFIMLLISIITIQFGTTPTITISDSVIAYFGLLFALHGIMYLSFYPLIFKYPFKIRSYIIPFIIYVLGIGFSSTLVKIESRALSFAIAFAGFAFFGLIMLLTYALAKNKRGDI